MLNYLPGFERMKNFIVSYIIIFDSIYISYSNFSSECIPYTKENEKKILDTMRKQAIDSEEHIKSYYDNAWKYDKKVILGTACSALWTSSLLTSTGNKGLCIGLLSFSLLSVLTNLIGLKLNAETIKDMEKNVYFIENEKVINDWINRINNPYDGITKSAYDLLKRREKNSDRNISLTLNNIDSLSKNDLERIVDNISQSEEVRFKLRKNGENI